MSLAKHRASVIDSPTAPQATDKMIFGQILGVANAAGGGNGLNVATVVTFPEILPANYAVHVGTSQVCMAYVTARTVFGFTVNLTPPAASPLGPGSFDVTVMAP